MSNYSTVLYGTARTSTRPLANIESTLVVRETEAMLWYHLLGCIATAYLIEHLQYLSTVNGVQSMEFGPSGTASSLTTSRRRKKELRWWYWKTLSEPSPIRVVKPAQVSREWDLWLDLHQLAWKHLGFGWPLFHSSLPTDHCLLKDWSESWSS